MQTPYALTAGPADRFLPAVVATPAGSAGAGRPGLERMSAGFGALVGVEAQAWSAGKAG